MAIKLSAFPGSTQTAPSGGLKLSPFPIKEKKEPTITPFVGGGYSFAELNDPFTGRPLLKVPFTTPPTYETPEPPTISLISPQRVATTFDPTKAQPITRDMLRNERLPSFASQSIRSALGAAYNEELDHQIALTLSGANTPQNLKLIPSEKNQAAGTLEAKLANDVIAGRISLLDAQLQDAKEKGIKLPESEPTLREKIQNAALKLNPQLLEPLATLQEDPLGLKDTSITGAGKKFIDTIVNSVGVAGDALADWYVARQSGATVSENVGNVLKVGARTVGAVLSPISALFEGAKQVPVLKSVSILLSYPFELLGEVGTVAVDRMLDRGALSKLPEQTKDDIREGAREAGALTAQLLGAKVGAVGLKKVLPSERAAASFRNELKAEVPELVEGSDRVVPIDAVPTKVINKFIAEKGRENAKAIIIQSLKTASEIKSGNLAPEKVLPEVQKAVETPIEEVVPKEVAPQVPKTETTRPSGVGKSIEAKAVENKLTRGFESTAEYEPIKVKEQAKLATDLINSDVGRARAMVRGEQPLPENMKGASLITAMEEYIKRNPEADLAYELANSPLVSATSAAAQELRLVAERAPDSATAKFMEVKKARELKAGGEKTIIRKRESLKSLKEETSKVNLTEKEGLSWDKFLEEIVC